MIRLLVADDHPIIVTAVETLLRDSDYEVVVHVRRGDEVAAAVESAAPDMLILDERMPGKNGLDVFRELRGAGCLKPTVLLSGTIDDKRALEAMDSGIEGILLKHSAPDQLLQCLDHIREGQRWIDQDLLQRALEQARGKSGDLDRFSVLTAREYDVVKLLAQNMRTRDVAERLGISGGTVKVHLHNIYEKLGLNSRVDLAFLLRDTGLAER